MNVASSGKFVTAPRMDAESRTTFIRQFLSGKEKPAEDLSRAGWG
jgi:hypothetical protein